MIFDPMALKHSEHPDRKPGKSRSLSRRAFLGLGTGALAAWLAGCRVTGMLPSAVPAPTVPPTPYPTPPPDTPLPPTYTPVPATPTVPPSPAPALTPASALDRATLMAHWPATSASRIVLVCHS